MLNTRPNVELIQKPNAKHVGIWLPIERARQKPKEESNKLGACPPVSRKVPDTGLSFRVSFREPFTTPLNELVDITLMTL